MARIVVELTNRCNLACAHCHDGRHGGKDDLSLEVLQRILASAKDEGFDELSLTGGDPTLHPEFPEILRICAGAGYRISLVTNGWNFATIYPQLLEQRQQLDTITFSLDGATEPTHGRLRGNDSYRRVLQAMSVCVALDLPFSINTVVTRHNQDELEDLVQLALQMGSRGIRFGHLMPTPRTARLDLDLSPDQRKQVEQQVRKLAESFAIPVVMAPGYHTSRPFPCGPLQGKELNVDCRGNLTKCCHLSSQGEHVGERDIIANLHDVEFHEAYRRWSDENAALRIAKQELFSSGEMQDVERFPCWFCSLYYDKVDWLHETPNHGWTQFVRRVRPREDR